MLRKGFEVNRCYYENCLETLLCMPDNLIDLVVTSPPYDKLRSYDGFQVDLKAIVPILYKKMVQGGVVVWVVGDSTVNGSESGTSFKQALLFMHCGFNLHDTMIYEKVGLTMNHNRYEQNFEYMFVFSKGKPNTFNPIMIPCLWYGKDSDRTGQKTGVTNEIGRKLRSENDRGNIKPTKIKGNIWRYNTGAIHSTKDKIAFQHPAIFPEKLAEDHILSWSDPTDIVYDPFAGSGTTLKMAKKHDRVFIGSEISSKYKPIIDARLKL